jgi:hypothetical protein
MVSRGAVAQEGCCSAHELAFAAGDEDGQSYARKEGGAHAAEGAGGGQGDDGHAGVQDVAACRACSFCVTVQTRMTMSNATYHQRACIVVKIVEKQVSTLFHH